MIIFEKIANLVCQAEFFEQSAVFLAKNASVFDDSDENKLEYTAIFESYVLILEQLIDTKLGESHSRAQIDAFYFDLM